MARPPAAHDMFIASVNSPEARALNAAASSELEQMLAAIEAHLAALGDALRERDSAAIERQAHALHQSLARAIDGFGHAARTGGVPPPLRERLMRAGGQVAAQRESLSRATAALDRAMDVLMPAEKPPVYGLRGAGSRFAV